MDAAEIAALHAESWRRHYRGAYSDSFLDGDVGEDRLAEWTGRFAEAGAGVAGSQPVLLYDAHGNVVGSEQAQFLTAAATDPNDPGYTACGTPEGLTVANWSDTVELFVP